MQISRPVYESIADLVAADTAFLAAVAAMKVHLVISSFTPSLDLDIDTLTLASFTGSTAKSAGTGTQQVFNDVVSGLRTIQILEPAGGWTWECTADPDDPETVYGYIVTDNAGTELIGSARLDDPVTINAAGQGVALPYIRIQFSPNGII